ncbi:MAG TPA: prefoldin subunit [Candidatus Acidoferrales bacterium]|nr:prefoldin subunit [Candidatus Acidoferrales bacterium]
MERDELEKMTREYQQMQEQLQQLSIQREQFSSQKDELKEAAAEIEKSTGKIYLAVGGIMVDVGKDSAAKSVGERQESADMRITILTKQIDELSKKEKILREDLTKALKDIKQ